MSKVILFLICSAVSAAAGLSKLDALAMIETGNNDAVIGSAGEVSRYQIKPRVWREYSPSLAWRDAGVSTQVAQGYLADLEALFRKRTGREATDFDLYVLWNAGPAYYARIDFSARRVGAIIRERANRYVNLREMRNAPPSPTLAAVRVPVSFPTPVAAPAPAQTEPRPRLDAPLPPLPPLQSGALPGPTFSPAGLMAWNGLGAR
jgi:hypothetical protein